MKKPSIDDEIEDLEKTIISSEKKEDVEISKNHNDIADDTKSNSSSSSNDTTEKINVSTHSKLSKLNKKYILYVSVPIIIALSLYFIKPNFIMKGKKKNKVDYTRLSMVTAVSSVVLFGGYYGYTKYKSS